MLACFIAGVGGNVPGPLPTAAPSTPSLSLPMIRPATLHTASIAPIISWHQASARLQDVDLDLPKVPERTRAQESRGRHAGQARLQTGKPGADVVRRENRRRGKASSFPRRRRPVRLRCRRGLTRTEAPSAAGPVAKSPLGQQDRLRLNRRRRRRYPENPKLTLLPLHRLPRSRIQLLVRRYGFLMATRRSL